jgi:hypothetical protein
MEIVNKCKQFKISSYNWKPKQQQKNGVLPVTQYILDSLKGLRLPP